MSDLVFKTALSLYEQAATSQPGAVVFDSLTADPELLQAKAALVRLGVLGADQPVPNAQANRRPTMLSPLTSSWKPSKDFPVTTPKAKLANALLSEAK